MSSDSLPSGSEVVAFVLVVESSLAVAAEWPRIIMDYVVHILRRLTDLNPGHKLRIGFVTYAGASTEPTPILCKRFFTELSSVMREMREDSAKLGIGQTNSGGIRGMAALEGLVAAIELFDVLHNFTHTACPSVNHIFHVAASAPDTSIHPHWNDSPSLDAVTWDDLPAELKRRNINISSVNLHSNLPRFTDLHLAVVQGTSKDLPWFPVRPGHIILLSGLPVPLQKSAKRAGEPHPTERTPDTKRLRLGSQPTLEASPKTSTRNTPSNPTKLSPVPPHIQAPSRVSFSTLPQPPPQHPSQPPSSHNLSSPNFTSAVAQYQGLANSVRGVEEQLRAIQLSMQSAHLTGDVVLAESLMQEFNKKTLLHQKVKHMLMAITAKMHAQVAAANQNQNNQGQAQIQGQQTQPLAGSASSLPDTLATLQSPQLTSSNDAPPPTGPNFGGDGKPDLQMLAQLMHHRSVSGSSAGPPGNVVPQAVGRVMSGPVATQMQKLIEQTQRLRPDNISSQGPGLLQGQGTGVGVGVVQHGQTLSGQSLSEGTGKPLQIWQGSLTWSGTNPNGGKKEVTVYVVARTSNPSESRVETWPEAMSLAPIRSVSMSDLRLWLARFKPIMCTFMPQTDGVPDAQVNVMNLKMLVNLLATKSYYASASWTRPSGEQGTNALFLPTSHGLTGAIFPVTGLPELPKPSNVLGLPAELAAMVQHLSPEKMEQVLMQWRKHREGMAINQGVAGLSGGTVESSKNTNSFDGTLNLGPGHLQQQSGGSGGLPTLGGNAQLSNNSGGGGLNVMNTMGVGLGQPHTMGLSAMPVSGGAGSTSEGVGVGPGNVSYEILKSFSQRGGGINGQGQQ